ncbi:MAG: LCP family protein [Lachnospiraceae bacterium]|nr:LCP family protein [Lachnospiraceae bacterium]
MKKKIILRVVFTVVLILTIGGSAAWGYYDAVMAFFKESNDVDIDNDDGVYDEDIINILVVGSDRRSDESARGRSDSTMIATIDMKEKKVKVTSLMRDMYVDIPGHGMDKFNSSYAYGGVELLADTVTTNFDIKLDGYVIVDFSSFRKVIDKIGGVEIDVTEEEAEYLNTTKFIAKAEYRNLKAGKQTLNGYQALAYSRIRKVAHPEYGDGEFGRCLRQQAVLQSILDKVKDQNLSTILSIATSLMSDVSTDLDATTIKKLVKVVMKFELNKIESLRVPYEGTYLMGRRNGMFVFIINLEANKAVLQKFIFDIGDDDVDYSKDFGEIEEPASDGSSTSSSYNEDSNIYDTATEATNTSASEPVQSTETTTQREDTEEPTTAEPATEAPTTAAPTTAAPATEAPTTAESSVDENDN